MAREGHLYQTIAESVRQQILDGRLKPGDRLPPIRKMTERWGCSPGTVQRAYQELAGQGLLSSRQGRGTEVSRGQSPALVPSLLRARLVNRAEGFLLEALATGSDLEEVEQAFRLALDRWRSPPPQPPTAPSRALRFVGSHDLAVDWLTSHFGELARGYRLDTRFAGSLGGLIALAEDEADFAGCHLWDEETETYNAPFLRRLLPSHRVALVTLARRRLGLIVPTGNPLRLRGLGDLSKAGVRFVNRQSGSGTRVWLDVQLRSLGIQCDRIEGFEREEMTHAAVARRIAEGTANAGVGLEAAAAAFGLDFIFLVDEPYQLAVPAAAMERAPLRKLIGWLKRPATRSALGSLHGYDVRSSGEFEWVG